MKTITAVRYFGSKAALARVLGISRQAVTDWGEDVPELRAFQLAEMSGGELKAPRVRPVAPVAPSPFLKRWIASQAAKG
jgi:DNA-binding transcriptional regulator YdaS (Cro superfamily)